MKSATKKLSTEIAETLSGKIAAVSAGSKKIKKSIEKAAAKLAKKVEKFEKETQKKQEKDAKNAEKKSKGKEKGKKEGKKEKAAKVAALVAAASSKTAIAAPPKPLVSKAPAPGKPVGSRPAGRPAKVAAVTSDQSTSEGQPAE